MKGTARYKVLRDNDYFEQILKRLTFSFDSYFDLTIMWILFLISKLN